MNFNRVMQFIDNGLDPDQILAYLGKNSPKISKKISQMIIGGFGLSEIVDYLSRDQSVQKEIKVNGKPYNPSDIARLTILQNKMNVPKTRDQESLETLKKYTKHGIETAALIAPFALPYMRNLLGLTGTASNVLYPDEILNPQKLIEGQQQKALPFQEQLGLPNLQGQAPIPPSNEPIIPPYNGPPGADPFIKLNIKTTNPMAGETPGKLISEEIKNPQPVPIVPPVPQKKEPIEITPRSEPRSEVEKLKELLFSQTPIEDYSPSAKADIDHIFKNLSHFEKQGMPPEHSLIRQLKKKLEGIVANPKNLLPSHMRPTLKMAKETVAPTASRAPSDMERFGMLEQQLGLAPEQTKEKRVPNLLQPPEKIPTKGQLVKGSEAIMPSGDIAIIEELPGKTAKINLNGKKAIIETEKLTPLPENTEEIADLYQRLLDKIPEGEKSRMALAVGFDADNGSLAVTFMDGSTYHYDDVPEEIVKEIINSDFMAKTSGGNYIGAWYKGNPSIGAGISQLIKDLQAERGGKGKEYSRKYKEMYSLHRYPMQKLKEKHEAERQAKKKK